MALSLNIQPAACGYLPEGGWPNDWAADHHVDSCDACGEITARANEASHRRHWAICSACNGSGGVHRDCERCVGVGYVRRRV